jgi:starch-binding outer membrane protein, SusD/RagB family
MKALYGFLLPTTFQINTNRLVYAIPFRETLLNTKLEQNFGY